MEVANLTIEDWSEVDHRVVVCFPRDHPIPNTNLMITKCLRNLSLKDKKTVIRRVIVEQVKVTINPVDTIKVGAGKEGDLHPDAGTGWIPILSSLWDIVDMMVMVTAPTLMMRWMIWKVRLNPLNSGMENGLKLQWEIGRMRCNEVWDLLQASPWIPN